jgi:uncharacterized radical SAM superfamily Fe-S cluster-containing enzyme
MHQYRDHNFLGTTKSLCPQCLSLVDAKIITRGNRVYFRKFCEEHGFREDFVCSDASHFDRNEFTLPGKQPTKFGIQPKLGCPYDCGVCSEHEQHTCIGLLEITSHCNLECPICFAGSGPGGTHLTLEQCKRAIDRLVEVETQPEILQLSGGEPTIHPDFENIFQYACEQPIDIVMINTNGLRIARDSRFVDFLASHRKRCEVYFQFDSFEDIQTEALRGVSLVETKLRAIQRLGEMGIRTTLVCTLQAGVNEEQIGPITEFALERPWITGVSFQPTTYTGRYFLPDELENRITFPDILHGLESQTDGKWKASDFSPLPCAHPNGHTLAYTYRRFKPDLEFTPLARFIDIEKHIDLLSGRITFDRPRAKELISTVLDSFGCGLTNANPSQIDSALGLFAQHLQAGNSVSGTPQSNSNIVALAKEFLHSALSMELEPEHMLRITTTSFMDAYNFDIRQLMKSCVHHILPSGHIIPFSAYNVLYRDGHVPLPDLTAPPQSSLVPIA